MRRMQFIQVAVLALFIGLVMLPAGVTAGPASAYLKGDSLSSGKLAALSGNTNSLSNGISLAIANQPDYVRPDPLVYTKNAKVTWDPAFMNAWNEYVQSAAKSQYSGVFSSHSCGCG